jgi:hypothetical protein
VWLVAIEAEDASADTIAGREDADAIVGGHVAPGGGDLKPRPCLRDRTQRGRETKPLIPRSRARALRKIESNATQSAPNLRSKLPIPPIDRIDERPSLPNDLKNTIQELSLQGAVHAPQRSFRDTYKTNPHPPPTQVARKAPKACTAPYNDSSRDS